MVVPSHCIRRRCNVVRPHPVFPCMSESARFDAGDLGCGEGLGRQFTTRLGELPVGGVLEVTVSDPSAKADLPPLARLQGHRILSEEPLPEGRLLIRVERCK
jgi:TusA-related sulfurtransferase